MVLQHRVLKHLSILELFLRLSYLLPIFVQLDFLKGLMLIVYFVSALTVDLIVEYDGLYKRFDKTGGSLLNPLLSGLFGISALVTSLSQNAQIPKQHITESIKVKMSSKVKAIGAAVFSGSLTGIMPGLGAAQAAIIATQLVGDIGVYAFMILLGGINTVNFTFSLVTFYTLQKARNGAVVAILEILKSISLEQLLVFLFAALIAGGIATLLALFFARVFSKMIVKVNYKFLCLGIISFITLMAVYFSGFIGLLILITSTAVGIIPGLLGVKRSHAMGCLLLPVILFFVL